MYIKCPACDNEIFIDEFSQAIGIVIGGCQFHSETKNFNGYCFFKIHENQVKAPRVRTTGGTWIPRSEHEAMIKARKVAYYKKKSIEEKERKRKDEGSRYGY